MKRVLVLFLTWFCATTAGAVDPPEPRITVDLAKALVMASLTAQQRWLPKVEAESAKKSGVS